MKLREELLCLLVTAVLGMETVATKRAMIGGPRETEAAWKDLPLREGFQILCDGAVDPLHATVILEDPTLSSLISI